MHGTRWQKIAAELFGIVRNIRRDTAGNTLAIMAAALIPLAAFTGSAIDMARLYVVKVRLQQACDAGVLAGRKFMSDTTSATPLDSTAATQAQNFFTNNFKSGWFQTTTVSFTPSKVQDSSNPSVANTVAGTATATVPMTLLQLFGKAPVTMNVACQAHYDLADTDVMFVLDTTGSMSCVPSASGTCTGATTTYTRDDGSPGVYNAEASGSKIDGLRQAVMLFDSTMRANADPTTHFRYGFVTYSSGVNVGYSIPSQYLQTGVYKYQTRTIGSDYSFITNATSVLGVSAAACAAKRFPTTGYVKGTKYTYLSGSNPQTGQAAYSTYFTWASTPTWTSANGGTCTGTAVGKEPYWHYDRQPQTITSALLAGTAVTDPTQVDGSTSKWQGCVEELDTLPQTSFDIDSLPADVNPDTIPTNSANLWRPQWGDVEWLRNSAAAQDVLDANVNEASTSSYTNLNYGPGSLLAQNEMFSCGMPAKRLQVMSAQQVHDYVYDNDFRAYGSTYHDIGMIWGARMMSPNGIFGADTAAWPGRNAPTRNIVFMTDGAMETFPTIPYAAYSAYGIEQLDGRVDGGSTGNDSANHTARFRAVCDYAKSRLGYTIYVVAFGTSLTPDLNYCASPGQAFQASSTAQLTAAFKSIAQRVAMLRITQ